MIWGRALAVAMALGVMALGVTALAPVAAAQTPNPTAAEKATARGLVRDGRAKLAKGDVDGALADFLGAHQIMGVPTTGTELGKAQIKAGMLVEALDMLLSVGRIPKERREPRAFDRARKEAKELAKELAARIPAARVLLKGEAADGAEVTVDGQPMPAELVGAAYKVNPGVHEIVARNDEAEARAQIDLEEGEVREVILQLDPPPDEPPPPPPSSQSGTHPLVWAGLGLAGAGLVAGTITGALALNQNAEIAPQCPNQRCPPDVVDDLDGARTLGDVSTPMFVIGGVGAIATVVGLFLPYETEPEAGEVSAGLRLRVGPTAMMLEGRF